MGARESSRLWSVHEAFEVSIPARSGFGAPDDARVRSAGRSVVVTPVPPHSGAGLYHRYRPPSPSTPVSCRAGLVPEIVRPFCRERWGAASAMPRLSR